jgi:hypothetical protein
MGAVTPTTVSSFHALREVLRIAVWEAGAKADLNWKDDIDGW